MTVKSVQKETIKIKKIKINRITIGDMRYRISPKKFNCSAIYMYYHSIYTFSYCLIFLYNFLLIIWSISVVVVPSSGVFWMYSFQSQQDKTGRTLPKIEMHWQTLKIKIMIIINKCGPTTCIIAYCSIVLVVTCNGVHKVKYMYM